MSETNSLRSDTSNVSTNLLVASTAPSVISCASSASPVIQINSIEYEMIETTLNKQGKTS